MKDKIVLMFEEELQKRRTNPPKVTRIEKELFQISDRIFIINAKDKHNLKPRNIFKLVLQKKQISFDKGFQ